MTTTTRIQRHIKAPRSQVYRALIDPQAVATWMVPAGGTDLLAVHDNVPSGITPADNALGWRMSLDKLAALVEEKQIQ